MNNQIENKRKKLREAFRSLQQGSQIEIVEWSPDAFSNGKKLLGLCKKSSDKERFNDVEDVQDFVDDLLSNRSNAWIARTLSSEKIVGICIFRKWKSIKSRRNDLIKQDLKMMSKEDGETFKENFRLLEKEKKLNQFSSPDIDLEEFESNAVDIQLLCVDEKLSKKNPQIETLLLSRMLFEIDLSILHLRNPFSSVPASSFDFVGTEAINDKEVELLKNLGFQTIEIFEDKKDKIPLKSFQVPTLEKLRQTISSLNKNKTISDVYVDIFSQDPKQIRDAVEKKSPTAWNKLSEMIQKIEKARGLEPSKQINVEKDIIRSYEPVLYKTFPFFSPLLLEKLNFQIPSDLKQFYQEVSTKSKKKNKKSSEPTSDVESIPPINIQQTETEGNVPEEQFASTDKKENDKSQVPQSNAVVAATGSKKNRKISFIRGEIDQILDEMKTSDKELNCVLKRMKTCSFEQAKILETGINQDIKENDVESAAVETISALGVDRIKVYDFAEFLSHRYRALIGKYNGILQKLNREISSPENDVKKTKCKAQISKLNSGFKASQRVLLRWIRHGRVIDLIFPEQDFYGLDEALKESVKRIATENVERKIREESISEDEPVIDSKQLDEEIDQISLDARYSVMKNMILNKLDVSPVSVRDKDLGGVTDRYVQALKPAKEKSLIDQRQQLQNEFITRQNDIRQYSSLQSCIRNPLFRVFFYDTVLSKRSSTLFEKMTEFLIKDLLNLWDFGAKLAHQFQNQFPADEQALIENPSLLETTFFSFVHRVLDRSEPDVINYWCKLCQSIKDLKNSKRDSIRLVESLECSIVDKIVHWIFTSLPNLGIDFSYTKFSLQNPSTTPKDFLQQLKSSDSWRKDLESNFSLFLENNTSFSVIYVSPENWIESVRTQLLKREPEERFKLWYREGISVLVEILKFYLKLLRDSLDESLEFELLSRFSSDAYKNTSIDFSQTLIRKLGKTWSRFFGIDINLPEISLQWSNFFQEIPAWKSWLREDRQFSFDSTFTSQLNSKETFQLIKNSIAYRLVPSPMITFDIRENGLLQYLKTQMHYEFLYHWPDRLLRSFQYFTGNKESYLVKRGIPDATFGPNSSSIETEDKNQFPFWTMVTDYQNVETRLFFKSPQVMFALLKKEDAQQSGYFSVSDLGISDTISSERKCLLSPKISCFISSIFDAGFKDPFEGIEFSFDRLKSFFGEFFPDIPLLESSIRRQANPEKLGFKQYQDSQQSFLSEAFDRWKKLPFIYEDNKINTTDLVSEYLTTEGKIRNIDGSFVSCGIHIQEIDEKSAVKFSKENENFVWVHGDDFYSRISGSNLDGMIDKKISRYLGFVSYKCDIWPRDQKKGKSTKSLGFTNSGLVIEPKTKNSYNKTFFDPYPKAGHIWYLHLDLNSRDKKVWFKQTQKTKKPGKSEEFESWKGFVTSVVEFDSFLQPLSTNNGSTNDFSATSENPFFFSGKIPYLPVVPAIFKAIIESYFSMKEKGFDNSTVLLVRLNRIKRLGLLPENVLVYILRKYFDFALCLPESASEEFVDVRNVPYRGDMIVRKQWRVYTTVDRDSKTGISDEDHWEEIDETEPILFRPMPTLDEFWRLVQYYMFYFFEHQTRYFEKATLNDIPSLSEFLFADKELKLSGLQDIGPVYFTGFDKTLFTQTYIEKIKSKRTIPKFSMSTFSSTKMNIQVSSSIDLDQVLSSSKTNSISLLSWLDKNLDPWLTSKFSLSTKIKKPRGFIQRNDRDFHPFFNLIFYSDLYVNEQSFDDKRTVKKRQLLPENTSVLELKQSEEKIPEPASQIVGSFLVDPQEYRLIPDKYKETFTFKFPISAERSNVSIWLWKELNRYEKIQLLKLAKTFENKNYKQYLVNLYAKYDVQGSRSSKSFFSIPFSKLTDSSISEFLDIVSNYYQKFSFLFPPTKAWDSMKINANTIPYFFDSSRNIIAIENGWKQIEKRLSTKIQFTKEQNSAQNRILKSICKSFKADFAKSLVVFAHPDPNWLAYSSQAQPERIDWNGSKSMQEHVSTKSRLRYQQDDFVRANAYWTSIFLLDNMLLDGKLESLSLNDSLDILNEIATTFNFGQRTVIVTNVPETPALFEIIPFSERKGKLTDKDEEPDPILSEQDLIDLGIFISEPKVDPLRGRKYDSISLQEIDPGNTDPYVEQNKKFYSKNSSFYRLISSGTWRKQGFFGTKVFPDQSFVQVNERAPINKKTAKQLLSEIYNSLSIDPNKKFSDNVLQQITVPLEENPFIKREIVFPFAQDPKYKQFYHIMQSLESIASSNK